MLRELRHAIADAVSSVSDELQAQPYMLANPTPPSAHVYPTPVDYDRAMQRGLDEWTLTVQLFVAFITDVGAQEQLDRYLEPTGPSSVKAAIEGYDYSGIAGVDDVTVVRSEGYRPYRRDDGTVLLGSEWIVRVLASAA